MKFFAGAFAAIAAIAAVAVATTGNMSSDKSATENRSFKAKAVSENRSFKAASRQGVPSKNRSFKTQEVAVAVVLATTGNMSTDKSATKNRKTLLKTKAVSENRSFKTASGPGVPSKNRSFKTQKVRGHGSQNLCPFVHLPCFYSTRTHSQNSANPYPPLARGFAHS